MHTTRKATRKALRTSSPVRRFFKQAVPILGFLDLIIGGVERLLNFVGWFTSEPVQTELANLWSFLAALWP